MPSFRLTLIACAALALVGAASAQVDVFPGGAPLCTIDGDDAWEASGGQSGSTDVSANEARARAEGGFLTEHSSFAEIGVTFVPALSFPAVITISGIAVTGRLEGGVGPAFGAFSLQMILRDLDEDTEVAVPLMQNTVNSGDLSVNNPFAEGILEAELVGGTEYAVFLRLETTASGVAGLSDFRNGDRRVLFSCIAIVPDLEDTDGDGLYDDWEENGIDIDGGGIDLDLQDLGTDVRGKTIQADPQRKDIFVEIDYFDCAAGGDCAAGDTHDHDPGTLPLIAVVEAFAAAPVDNPSEDDPSGDAGINLWVLLDQALPHRDACDLDNVCFDPIKESNLGTVEEQANPAMVAAKELVFHYGLWIHDKAPGNSSSGEGDGGCDGGAVRKWGDDFVVSLGSWTGQGDVMDRAGTFMHELGHNLGLCHGGGDRFPCKPNYLSVMSYVYQTRGLPPFSSIDYSRAELPDLDESDLDETLGIQDGTLQTWHGPPTDKNGTDENGDGDFTDDWSLGQGMGSIDWNVDGDPTGTSVATDINNMETSSCGSSVMPPDVHEGFDDWANLRYNFRDSEFFPEGHAPGADEEIDLETAEQIRASTFWTRSNAVYEYSAKFLCGLQDDPDVMRLTRGFYGTTVNVLNSSSKTAEFFKSLVLSFPPAEQAPGRALPISFDSLPAGLALGVDCDDVQDRLFPDGFPEDYIEGFVVLRSNRRLDVTAVYTTSALDREGRVTEHSSIEVEPVSGRARHLDLAVSKSAASACLAIGDSWLLCFVLAEVQVENHGPADATDVTLTDDLTREGGLVLVFPDIYEIDPPGQIVFGDPVGETVSWQAVIPDLPAGETATIRFLAFAPLFFQNISPIPPELELFVQRILVNNASTTSNEPDINPGNDSATVETVLP